VTEPDPEAVPSVADADLLGEALRLIEGANARGIPIRLVGGLAVRYLTPEYPPRTRAGQDLDLASVSRTRPQLARFLADLGYEPDKRFNALYGHKQLYFASPVGRSIDVLVDSMEMCHVVIFRDRIERHPVTLDVTDLLLTKLQIVELNEKDARDALYLLSAFEVQEGDELGAIGLQRIGGIVADDWGWWRTLTMNVERISELARGDASLPPGGARFDPVEQLGLIGRAAQEVPKSLRWKVRGRVGERKRWYRVPEEDAHD
jgi:hypothetical protein